MRREDFSPLTTRYREILDDAEAFDRAVARPIDRFLWVQHLRTDVATVKGLLMRSGFEVSRCPGILAPCAYPAKRRGWAATGLIGPVSSISRKPVP